MAATDVDLLVLGAGPAGLGAAWRAASAGHRVLVLEREDRVGGIAASIEVGGVRADLGSHRLHPTTPQPVMAALRDLLGDDLQRRPRRGRIRLAGRWIAFPLRPGDLARRLPVGFTAGIARDTLTAPWRRPAEDTFDAEVRAGLGPTMADRFYGPYARKLWGLDPTDIAGEQARRRISAGSVTAVVRRLLGSKDPDAGHFYYPRHGFGQLSEALADAAGDAGARIRLSTAATALHSADGHVDVATPDGPVRASQVFTTVPLPVLARLADDTPDEVVAAASALRSRAMVLVYLVLDVPRYTRFDAHYLPEPFTPVTRVSEPKNYRDGVGVDPPDRTVLCAELPADVGDEHWSADDVALGRLVLDALEEAGLPTPPVRETVVHRLPSVYPIYDRGFETHLERLETWASALDRILTFGRQGLFVHDNSHHALAMAWAAADALRDDGTLDRDAWSRARAGFRDHVVED